jgi:hypothetical protein
MEGFQMKKRLILAVSLFVAVLFLSAFLASCAAKSLTKAEPVQKKGKTGEETVIEKSDDKVPKWAMAPEIEIARDKGEKVIFVKVDISNKDRRAAERIAEGELRKRIAEGIKTLVDSQFKEAMSGTESSFSESFESSVVTVANKVPVVGLIVTDTYWEKIQKFTSKKESEIYYRIVKRAKMPYKNYTTARDNAWNEVLAQQKSDAEKQALQAIIEKMSQGDEE